MSALPPRRSHPPSAAAQVAPQGGGRSERHPEAPRLVQHRGQRRGPFSTADSAAPTPRPAEPRPRLPLPSAQVGPREGEPMATSLFESSSVPWGLPHVGVSVAHTVGVEKGRGLGAVGGASGETGN